LVELHEVVHARRASATSMGKQRLTRERCEPDVILHECWNAERSNVDLYHVASIVANDLALFRAIARDRAIQTCAQTLGQRVAAMAREHAGEEGHGSSSEIAERDLDGDALDPVRLRSVRHWITTMFQPRVARAA